ncbi:MAG TPA: hypothetical protein VNG13_04025 [Mycobacteriales bacterium]|nr:hypothetical protein [Mycobacteriales bacterium]
MCLGAGEFGFDLGSFVVVMPVGTGDGFFEEVDVVVEGEQAGDDGFFEVFGGDGLAVTAAGASDLAGAAGVVAVLAAPSVRADAEVGAAAGQVAQQPGEQVVRGAGGRRGGVGAAFV